jgi:hypothetical protein
LGPNILLRTLFSKTLSLHSSLNYGKLILMISSLDLLTTGSSCLSTSGATGLLITESQRTSELARLQEVRWEMGGLDTITELT